MKILPVVLMTVSISSFAARDHQSSPDPKAILRMADEACRRVKTIEYTVVEEGAGDAANALPRVTATVRQARADVPNTGLASGKFMARGTIAHSRSQPQEFAFAYDGEAFRFLDPNERLVKVIKSPSQSVVGNSIAEIGAGLLLFPQFTADEPFKSAIKPDSRLEYKSRIEVAGVMCDLIAITSTIEHPSFGKRSFTFQYAFGVEDHLPRRFDTASNRRIARIIRLNEQFDDEVFAIVAPSNSAVPGKESAGFKEKVITGLEAKVTGLLAMGSEAPEWKLRDPEGREHVLSSYRGKIVVMDFWGTWCGPCLKAMPHIQSLHDKFKDRGVVVFGIAVADNEGDPVGFMKRKGYTYGLLLKGDEVAGAYKAVQLPTVYVIGTDGRILHAEFGYREGGHTELAAIIEKHLRAR